MKKNQIRKSVAALAMAAVVGVSLLGYGCGSKPASTAGGVSGDFIGTAKGMGGDVTVTLTLEDGKITGCTAEGKDETPGIGTLALEQLPAQIAETGSIAVDGVSGATITSTAIKEAAAAALTACGGSSSTASSAASGTASSAAASTAAKLDKVKVAVPNDTTNEARALTLLEKNGFFKLKADAGLTATKNDIEENPLNVTVDEVEAAQVPNVLQDEDYAVINSNYAIPAGLDPMTDALAMEDGSSAYVNVLVCKEGNENEPKIKALVAALQSQQVKDFMDENYKGAVVSVVETPTDGYDASIDYDALNGETVSCAATPAPHCEVLEVCKDILAAKGITLDIQEYDDYVIPNTIVEDGQCDTNYFQHQPYLDSFNSENGTHLVSVLDVHYEPLGIYAGKTSSLAELPDGATIAIPNDTSNEARALLLLEANGLITLKEGAGLNATVLDIESNPHGYEIKELVAEQIPVSLPDVDIAVINGNYALTNELGEALVYESAESDAATYVNVLVVKEGNEELPKIQALVEALSSDEVRDYIVDTYGEAVVPVF